MLFIFLFFYSFFSSEAKPQQNFFVGVGEKIILEDRGPYHFADKEGLKVFLTENPSFFTTSKVGVLDFYQNKTKYRLNSVNAVQFQFYLKVKPVLKYLTNFEWGFKDDKLLLANENLDSEIINFLIETCEAISDGSVLLDFKPNLKDRLIPPICRNSLRPTSEKVIKLVVIDSSKMKTSNYGIGAPSSIKWQIDNSGKLTFPDLVGETKVNKGRVKSNGDLLFVSNISIKNPITFESGSEVGIQQQGLFNRQATEWKKATTNISLEMLTSEKDQTKIKVILDKKSRTGQGLVFGVEKLSKTVFLKTNVWKKVLTYQDTNKSKSRNGIFGLGISGSSNSSRSKSMKEIWLQVTTDD